MQISSLAFSALLLSSGAASISAHAQDARSFLNLKDGKSYQLVSKYSGKCLDVRDHSLADGGTLQQWTCSGKLNQKYQAKDAYKSAWTFTAQESKLCIKVENESLEDGAAVVQSSYCPGNSPRAYIIANLDGSVGVQFTHSGKCLDVAGPDLNNGARIQQWSCHGGPNQQWQLVEQTENGGQKSWELKNAGVEVDAHNRILRTQSYPEFSYALVDKISGKDIWSKKTSAPFHADARCHDLDKIFVKDGSKVLALNPKDGKQIWSADLKTPNAFLSCVPGYSSIFAIHSDANGKLVSIEKASGKIRWEFAGKNLGFLGKDSDIAYLSSYDNNKQNVLAIATGTGQQRWKKSFQDGEWYFLDAKNRLLTGSNGKSYSRLNRDNGSTLWTYSGNGSADYLSLDFNQGNGNLYARQGRDLKRLNPDNGQSLWNFTLPVSTTGSIATTAILKSGDILITPDSSGTNSTSFIYLKADGSGFWQANHGAQYATAQEDSKGNLFVRSGQSLILVDRATGAAKWNFVRNHAPANENIFAIESYGDDTYISYGSYSGRYPPMGIVRIDTRTGAAQWDFWVNETVSFLAGDQDHLLTMGPMASRVVSYKR